MSASDAVHLDMLARTRRHRAADLAVAVVARMPHRGDESSQLGIARPGAQGAAQVVATVREQAGVELAVGGQARTRAIAAERFRDRTDEADLATAVGECPA